MTGREQGSPTHVAVPTTSGDGTGQPDLPGDSPGDLPGDLPGDAPADGAARLARLETEVAELRSQLAVVGSDRDAMLHLLLATGASVPGRMALWWADLSARHPMIGALMTRPLRSVWLFLTLRKPGWLRVNPLFDEAFYRERYPDAPTGRGAAWRQYRRLSRAEGRDPNPLFDTDWYLERNPDVRSSRLDPLDHYLWYGWREGRAPGPDFNGFDYLRHHPDCVRRMQCPLLHHMRTRTVAAAGQEGPPPPGRPSAITRTLTYQRRNGTRRTLERVARAVVGAGPAGSAPAPAGRPVVPEVRPQAVWAHLDVPLAGAAEGSPALVVSGWACSRDGIAAVEVHVPPGRVVSAVTGLPRPDVAAALPDVPGSGSSGFSARVNVANLAPGGHDLQVVIRDAAGSTRVLRSSFGRVDPELMYHHWYVRSLPSPEEVEELRRWAAETRDAPHIHLVVIDDGQGDLAATIRSIDGQGYPRLSASLWSAEGAGAGDQPALGPGWSRVTRVSEALPATRDRDRLVGFLAAGERLAPAALPIMARESRGEDVALLYSDHDAVERTERHVDPWFVPDWSPDHLLSRDYVGGVYLARDTSDLRAMAPRLMASGRRSWRYELLLALSEADGRVLHVPRVLWSASAVRLSADDRAHREEEEREAVERALVRRGRPALVRSVTAPSGPVRDIRWPITRKPRVSVIVPTTGRADLVRRTLHSLREGTDYPDLEIIFVDNSRGRNPDGIALLDGADVRVLERDEPFNWARLNNAGARVAAGELLLFMNDDMEVTSPDWLAEMVRQAMRAEVGAVGALLLFPDGTIQHAGVFLVGHGGGAVHLLHGQDPDGRPYLDLHRVAREASAVTGACLLVQRGRFMEVGGFREELEVIGNDVDLCLRLARRGYRTMWTPQARLVHHESASRSGISHLPDEARMWAAWSELLLAGDPYHNPNLAQDRTDCLPDWGKISHNPDRSIDPDKRAGVNLVGYISAESGIGEACRGVARALTEAGVPFVILEHRAGNPARMADRSWAHKVVDAPVYETNLLHFNPDVLATALSALPAGLPEGRRNIGYWTWELPEFPAEWVGAFGLIDEVWAPSTFVRDAIAPRSPVPVHVVPHHVRHPEGPFLPRGHFGLPEEAFTFLAMYDVNSVTERKNPQGALEAFRRAFPEPRDDVLLVLKVSNSDDRELRTLRESTAGRPDVRLLAQVLDRHEVDSLMACCDVFVSLHRSEGFGLPIAEAMALGKPVIATGWSGNMDFMTPDNAACVSYQLAPIGRSQGPYAAGQLWAEPDLDDAASWMRRLREEPALGARLGAAASCDAQALSLRFNRRQAAFLIAG